MNIKWNHMGKNPMIGHVAELLCAHKADKFQRREYKMNTITEKSQWLESPAAPVLRATSCTSAKVLATALLAAGVAALVVTTDHLIEAWAEKHVIAAWVALWLVAVVAIAALRGVTRWLAQNVMRGLDAWSAHVARRRSDERVWAMAQTDSRLMTELQSAIDRTEDLHTRNPDLTDLMSRRVARLVKNRLHYI
ncbi:MAG: hypothetical protein RLZZ95_958 [Pseudomonadota bacterium]